MLRTFFTLFLFDIWFFSPIQVKCLHCGAHNKELAVGCKFAFYKYEEGINNCLTWFIRRIVPLVFAASTYTPRNKVGGFVHILKIRRISLNYSSAGWSLKWHRPFSSITLFWAGKKKFPILQLINRMLLVGRQDHIYNKHKL